MSDNFKYQEEYKKMLTAMKVRQEISDKGNLTEQEKQDMYKELMPDASMDDYNKDIKNKDNTISEMPSSLDDIKNINNNIIDNNNDLKNIKQKITQTENNNNLFSDIVGGLGNVLDLSSLVTNFTSIKGVADILNLLFKVSLSQLANLTETETISDENMNKFLPGLKNEDFNDVQIDINTVKKPVLPEIPITADNETKKLADIAGNKAILSSFKMQSKFGKTVSAPIENPIPDLPAFVSQAPVSIPMPKLYIPEIDIPVSANAIPTPPELPEIPSMPEIPIPSQVELQTLSEATQKLSELQSLASMPTNLLNQGLGELENLQGQALGELENLQGDELNQLNNNLNNNLG